MHMLEYRIQPKITFLPVKTQVPPAHTPILPTSSDMSPKLTQQMQWEFM